MLFHSEFGDQIVEPFHAAVVAAFDHRGRKMTYQYRTSASFSLYSLSWIVHDIRVYVGDVAKNHLWEAFLRKAQTLPGKPLQRTMCTEV